MSSPLYFDVPSYRSALASHLHAYDEWHQDSTVSPFSWPIFAKAQAALHPEMYQLAHITGHPLMLLCFSARFFFPLSLTVSFFICILHTGLQFVSSLLQTPHGQDSCCQDWHETPPPHSESREILATRKLHHKNDVSPNGGAPCWSNVEYTKKRKENTKPPYSWQHTDCCQRSNYPKITCVRVWGQRHTLHRGLPLDCTSSTYTGDLHSVSYAPVRSTL